MFERPQYLDSDRKPLLLHIPADAHSILDVGCNRGGFGRAIKATREAEVWGVEPDAASADAARDCLDQVITDIFDKRNPIPEGYFDLVTFNDSLEHMIDPGGALELAKTKLRAGGRVQCCVPNIRYIDNLEHLLCERDWRYEEQGIRDRTHLRFFTEKSIVRLFECTGYRVIRTIGINECWWERDKLLRRLLFRLFPALTRDMRYMQTLVIAEPL